MVLDTVNVIAVVLTTVIVVICSIGIIIAIKFQSKQRKKYKELNRIIKEKKDATFQIKDGLTKEEINSIDNEINVDILMQELYSVFLKLENRIRNFDTDLDNILIGNFKDFTVNKIKNGFIDVNDGINLISYSITEYSKENLKFRLTINCFSYRMVNNQIVSGNNLEKIQKILLLSFVKQNDKWLISHYDKIYEKN